MTKVEFERYLAIDLKRTDSKKTNLAARFCVRKANSKLITACSRISQNIHQNNLVLEMSAWLKHKKRWFYEGYLHFLRGLIQDRSQINF